MRTASILAAGVLGLSACASNEGVTAPGPAPSAPPDDPLATLPDALVFADGHRVTTKGEWPARRAELLDLFAKTIYGRPLPAPETSASSVVEENAAAMNGAATLRRVTLTSTFAGRTHSFELTLFVPHAVPKAPVFVLLSTKPRSATDPTRAKKSEYWPAEDVIARGYAIAAIQADALAPDDEATYTEGVIRLFEGDAASAPRPPDATKAIGAWSWGLSRAIDHLVTDASIDAARIAVVGHSRGGKAALWAGAQDERIALTVANGSGCAGAAISRHPVGENVALVAGVYPYWFADTFATYANREDELPVDQHELVALVAPRAVAIGSGSEDNWADPEGEYLGLAHASSVYALFGVAAVDPHAWPKPGASIFVAPRAYHLRPGGHELSAYDWQRYLDAADALWRR